MKYIIEVGDNYGYLCHQETSRTTDKFQQMTQKIEFTACIGFSDPMQAFLCV